MTSILEKVKRLKTKKCQIFEMARKQPGFTLVELLVVITVIAILAGLVLGVAGQIQNKSARSRAETEITAISNALENYKAEYGFYPSNSMSGLQGAQVLYQSLCTTNTAMNPSGRIFFTFPKAMAESAGGGTPTAILDPLSNAYEYRSGNAASNNGPDSFDLWSTLGSTSSNGWAKNW